MSTTQTTLYEFHDPAEFTEETFTKTVIFDLKEPTKRKRERMDAAIDSAMEVQAEAARRLPSVPPERWGVAKPKRSTWYAWAKEMDSHLSNKDVHENIQRVREAFRSWQSQGYDGERPAVEKFLNGERCAFYYGKPTYTVHDGAYYVSLPMAAGRGERELLPLRDGEYLREYADDIIDGAVSKGRAELVRDGRAYRLHQAIRTDVEILTNPQTMIGVDIGLTNLAVAAAVDSEGKHGAELWSGSQAAEMRNRFSQRKQQAQSDGEYEQIRDDEMRYIEHVCHTISRSVVDWALTHDRPMLVLEDLTDIRETFLRREREHTASERRALHSWPFRKLQDMIEYKATESGMPVSYIDPRHTSQMCNECGHTAKTNRSGVHFGCENCGYQVHADVNGAINIAYSGPS